MRTKKKIAPSSSVEITLPRGWSGLDDRQLRYVCALLAAGLPPDEVKVYALMRLAGFRPVRRRGKLVTLVRRRQIVTVTADELAAATLALDWMDAPPDVPVRVERMAGAQAVDAELHGIPFSDYLALENFYQGYLLTQDAACLERMARLLYPKLKRALRPEEGYIVLQWVVGLKQLFSRTFGELFRPSGTEGGSQTPDMAAVMNAEIRALTGGDVTKEREVLEADCWRALTELDAKAGEARMFNEKMKQ